ncbi:MAG: permease-like cell division protein FtsX [Patescibacteria group bacterium]
MLATNLRRVFKNALLSFSRNAWVSVATVSVMVLALFVVGSLMFFQVLLSSTLADIESKVDVSVYFKIDATEQEIVSVRDLLLGLPEVKNVEYVSREAALEAFKKNHEGNALITSALEELGENPLNATLKVRAKDPGKYESIAKFIEDGSFLSIDKVNYRQNKAIFDKLTMILSVSRRVGAGVVTVLSVIAFLVAFNTIRLAIYTARDEIAVMRVVGASNWFVRGPFLVEGALYGVLATIVTILIFWPLTLWLGPKTKDFFGNVDVFQYYTSHIFSIFFTLLFIGIVLGVLSSFVATRRYLKL